MEMDAGRKTVMRHRIIMTIASALLVAPVQAQVAPRAEAIGTQVREVMEDM